MKLLRLTQVILLVLFGTFVSIGEAGALGPHATYVVDTSADTNPASPATACAVGNPGTCSLRAAVLAADADTGNVDAVTIPAGTDIALSNAFGTVVLSNSMVIDGAGATVNGGGAQDIFDENAASASVQITGLELTGGDSSQGGAVFLAAGSLVLSNVDITANIASAEGGGVYQGSGQLWVDHSTFSNNSAGEGAGIYMNAGSAQIEDTTFGGSSTSAGNVAADGSGVYNSGGDVIVNGCTFDFNTGAVGVSAAGVDVYNNAVMDLTNSTFDHTSATFGGEGVDVLADQSTDLANITIDNTSITGGGSVSGGAIYAAGFTTDLTNVSVDNTTVPVAGKAIAGGAVYLASTKVTWNGGSIANTTNGGAADNDATEGGALYTDSAGATVTGVAISNTNTQADSNTVDGGAVYNAGPATFDNVSITGTSSLGGQIEGGAVYNGSSLDLTNVQISSTTSHSSLTTGGSVQGGVLYNNSYLSINTVSSDVATVTADLATTPTPSPDVTDVAGGDFFNSDYVNADGLSFTNTTVNAAGGNGYVEGGGLDNNGDYMNFNNTEVVGMTVSADHYVTGGLFYNTENFTAQNLTLGNATVSVPGTVDSGAPYADGAILYTSEPTNIVNGTMANVSSTVGANGGANYGVSINQSAGVQFTNTTIANDAMTGPAGNTDLIQIGSGDSLSLLNTIVDSTTPAANCGFAAGSSLNSVGNNLDNGDSCGFNHPGDLPNTDPMVATLADNGGPVQTAALLAGSPAIGAGTNNGCPLTDARGVSRGTACDIGSYQFVAAPIVSKLFPTKGPVGGGTLVIITGSNLAGATSVHFGSPAGQIVKAVSASEIEVTAPAGSGTVDVTVTTTGGTSAKTAADHFTWVAAPIVSALSPNSGPVGGGTLVTITGSNLARATAVQFGASGAPIVKRVSASEIQVTSPKGSGTVDVTVTTAGGTSAKTAADHYGYVAAPIVSALSPNSGPVGGGTVVKITGSNLAGATAVYFGSSAAHIDKRVSTSEIDVTSPAGSGTVDVTVTTAGGTSAKTAADHYTY
jgi:hypothetical protein